MIRNQTERGAALVWALCAVAALAGRAGGKDLPECSICRAATPPKLDGALDAPCWKTASWQGKFTVLAADGAIAAQRTEFAMLWDDKFLYIGIRLHEPEMDKVKAAAPPGSPDIFSDDHTEIFLCLPDSREVWQQLVVNAAGARLHNVHEADGAETMTCGADDAKIEWKSAVKRLSDRWQVEMAVPLTMLRFKARQDAAIIGNVARTRFAGGGGINSTWSPLAANFHEPNRFGVMTFQGQEGKTEAVAGQSSARIETLITAVGDRLRGAALGTVEGKWLRFQGAQFKEPIAIDLTTIRLIEENVKPAAARGTRVALTNWDYVIGSLNRITAEKAEVVMASGAEIALPVASLAGVTMKSAESSGYIESMFDADEMAPWTPVRGTWTLSKGIVRSMGTNQEALLAAPVEQKGAMTFVADIEPIGANTGNCPCEMILLGSRLNNAGAMGGLMLNFWGTEYQLATIQSGVRNYFVTQKIGEPPAKGRLRLRLAYDPATGDGRYWVNDAGEGFPFKSDGPKTGTQAAIGSWQPIAVRRLVVMPGIHRPGEERESAPDKSVLVALVNGDSVTSENVFMNAGRLTLKTPLGEITPESDRVREIRFIHKARKPEAASPFVRVEAADCRLTFDSCEIFEDRVIGHSAQYGAVTIGRDSIEWIQFHPEGKPETVPAAASERIETVTTAAGNCLNGAVLGTDGEKWLRFQGAQFKEPIAIDFSTIDRIEEKDKPDAAKGARVALTNGDYVIGSLNRITAEKAEVALASGATIAFPIANLAGVAMKSGEGSGYAESMFDTNVMEPWTPVRGDWILSNGRVQIADGTNFRGGEAVLAAPVVQKGAVTFVADIEPLVAGGRNCNCEMIVFGSRVEDAATLGGLVLSFNGTNYQLFIAQPGQPIGRMQVARQMLGKAWAEGHLRLRLAYDAAASEGCVWINDEGKGFPFTADGPKSGTHVAIGAMQPLAVKRLVATPGIHKPGEKREAVPDESVLVRLTNGDSVTSDSVLLSGGRLTLKTPFGEITPEADRVREIRFVHKTRKLEASLKFVRVEAADCRLTFDSCEISEDRVIGHSTLYGAVPIGRNAIQCIQFQRGPG